MKITRENLTKEQLEELENELAKVRAKFEKKLLTELKVAEQKKLNSFQFDEDMRIRDEFKRALYEKHKDFLSQFSKDCWPKKPELHFAQVLLECNPDANFKKYGLWELYDEQHVLLETVEGTFEQVFVYAIKELPNFRPDFNDLDFKYIRLATPKPQPKKLG